jgi:alkylated DNA repair protein alkB homolog 6
MLPSLMAEQIPSRRWTQVSGRRVQAHPSILAKGNILISSPLPDWLTANPPILERFEKLGVFAGTKHRHPNHVLVNEYLPGQGIMPHEDGAAYSPVVATVSLGGSIVLDIKEKPITESAAGGESEVREPRAWRILQEPGSLLVTVREAYTSLLHGISYIIEDTELGPETVANWSLLQNAEAFSNGVNHRQTRISLTYRDVLKVSKLGGILGRK